MARTCGTVDRIQRFRLVWTAHSLRNGLPTVVGKTLGHYEILEPLGAGGMGEGVSGEDTRLGRLLALCR